ncbi:MAG: cystathionine beta-lyase, partial [Pseudomonadota bacterium]
LIVPNRSFKRLATPWDPEGPSFRIHAGLEDVDDLIADLEKGFAAFRAAAS